MSINKKGYISMSDTSLGGKKLSKVFKISWHAIVDEEETLLEGRSIVEAKTEFEAANKLIVEKASEYRLKQSWIIVDNLVEIIN